MLTNEVFDGHQRIAPHGNPDLIALAVHQASEAAVVGGAVAAVAADETQRSVARRSD
jgi:hypothetical protein